MPFKKRTSNSSQNVCVCVCAWYRRSCTLSIMMMSSPKFVVNFISVLIRLLCAVWIEPFLFSFNLCNTISMDCVCFAQQYTMATVQVKWHCANHTHGHATRNGRTIISSDDEHTSHFSRYYLMDCTVWPSDSNNDDYMVDLLSKYLRSYCIFYYEFFFYFD